MAKKTHTKKKLREAVPVQLSSADEFREQVARKAYQLFEQRGATHGQDLEDWFAAERLLQETLPSDPLLHKERKRKKRAK